MVCGAPLTLMIYIFGQIADPHISKICEILNRHDLKVEIFDQWSLDRGSITLHSGVAGFQFHGELLDPDAVSRSVFLWRIKPEFKKKISFNDRDQEDYWRIHWTYFQEAIHRLSGARCVNSPDAQLRARIKPVQLFEAVRAGLQIPDTTIGNDAHAAAFADMVFFKPMTADPPAEGALGFPDRFSREEVHKHADVIANCPGIFQAYCEKDHELRVCVFGETVHAFKLDSQAVAGAELDWRRVMLPDSAVSPISLSADEAGRCRAVVRGLGLDYGVLDLIRTPQGELVFLEVNPDGQWLWLERQTGAPLAEAFAAFLRSLLPDESDEATVSS